MLSGPGGLPAAAVTLVAGFLAGGGMGAALVTARADRRQRRRDALAADVRDAQDRLAALRDACRRRRLGLPDAPRRADVRALADLLDVAARRSLRPRARPLVAAYVAVAVERMHPAAAAQRAEAAAYEALATALAARFDECR